MADTITGVFPDRATADRALANLTSAGFTAHVLASSPLANGNDQGSVRVGIDAQGRDADAEQLLQRSGATSIVPGGSASGDTAPPPASAIPLDANGTIGGVAPSAVTDAAPQPETGEPSIGGIAPSAVSSDAPPATTYTADASGSPSGDDHPLRRAPDAPADTTIVSPGMETPYAQRQARRGDASERHPITDEDIIAEARHQRDPDQPADLDVHPRDTSPQTNR
jgi:hypothetical protein